MLRQALGASRSRRLPLTSSDACICRPLRARGVGCSRRLRRPAQPDPWREGRMMPRLLRPPARLPSLPVRLSVGWHPPATMAAAAPCLQKRLPVRACLSFRGSSPDLGCPSSAGVAAPCPRPGMLASGLPQRGEEEGPAPDARRGEKGGVAAGVGRVAANALAWPSTHISMGRAEREPGAALSAGRKGGPAPGGRRGERGGRRRPARR